MLKHQCLCLAIAFSLVTTSVTYGLVQLNFDQDIFTAPVGTPFVQATATLSLDGQHYLYGGTGHGSTSVVWADASFTLGPDPGEMDPNAQTAKFKAQIGDLPGLVPPDENVPITIPITWGYWHLDNWNLENAAGYPGYISASGWFESNGITDTYRVEFYNATEPGSRTDDPLLPDSINADGGFEFSFDVAETGIGRNFPLFVDPDGTAGYSYLVGPGDPNFAIIYIPEPLPQGDDQFELHLVGNVYPLLAGVPFDITQIVPEGVSHFSILGIDPSEGLDPTDPTAFVTGLTFVGGGNAVSLTMTPVPEPSMLALLYMGAIGLLSCIRRRRQFRMYRDEVSL